MAAVCACTNESEEMVNGQSLMVNDKAEVTLTFSPYEQEAMTRAATSVASVVTKLDVWIYESGSEVASFQQESGQDGFGTLSVTLNKTKTYTLYAVGHRNSAGHATLANGIISFADDKVSHSMFYSTTFTPSETTSLNCLMTRIVAQFQFKSTDQCPDDVTKMTFTLNDVYDRWSVTDGANHQLNRTSTFQNFTKMNDGTVTFNIYAIVTDAQTTHDITVTAYDSEDNIKQTRTFTDVPLRNGYKTSYKGVYFTDTPTAATFTVDDWNEYDEVTF